MKEKERKENPRQTKEQIFLLISQEFLSGISKVPKIVINIKPKAQRVSLINQKTNESLLIFSNGESVELKIEITPIELGNFEYNSISVSLVGELINFDTKENFILLNEVHELSRVGVINKPIEYEDTFSNIIAPYESYIGVHFEVKYYVKVTITKKLLNIEKNFVKNFVIQNIQKPPILIDCSKMEIGVSDKVHIEYEINQNKYHLTDIIVGKMYFLDVFCMIKSIEVQIVKKENNSNNILVGRVEVCDGQPYEGDLIPFRLYLSGKGLGPTIKNEIYSVKYFLKILIILENDKTLYKTQELIFWRKEFL